jgi:transcriptional regulator with XRE-family HTH domain
MADYVLIGDRLRLARTRAGLSLIHAARLVGIDEGVGGIRLLAEIEAGQVIFHTDLLARFASGYAVDLAWLSCDGPPVADWARGAFDRFMARKLSPPTAAAPEPSESGSWRDKPPML